MTPRRWTATKPAGSRPVHPPGRGKQLGGLIVLIGLGLLAAAVAGPRGSASTQATTTTRVGSPAAPPTNAWMTFEANPPSFILPPLRRFAACVRRHGITNLPNPKVIDGKAVLMLPHGLTRKSPRLKRAQRACQRLLPQAPNTQPGTGTGPTTTRPGSG
jgi:hypothetical protein